MSGLSQLRCLVIVIPADENARSLETDDAIIGSISRARDAQTSYRVAFHYNFIIRVSLKQDMRDTYTPPPLARFASIACLWAESVGAAELEASRSFPDAVSNRLGRGADEAVFVVILSDSGNSTISCVWAVFSFSDCG